MQRNIRLLPHSLLLLYHRQVRDRQQRVTFIASHRGEIQVPLEHTRRKGAPGIAAGKALAGWMVPQLPRVARQR